MMTSKFEANYSSNNEANPKSGFETVVTANCILNAPLMLLSIIGNALVLVAILRTPSIRSPSVIFLCNLAVADLLVGLVVQPAYIAEQIVRTVSALPKAVTAMGFAGCSVSLWTMTAITVDRFLALSLSPAVPKFNDNKPSNLYNSNYLVYYHVIHFFIYLVAEYLSLLCFSFRYHNFPFS